MSKYFMRKKGNKIWRKAHNLGGIKRSVGGFAEDHSLKIDDLIEVSQPDSNKTQPSQWVVYAGHEGGSPCLRVKRDI